MPGIDSVPSNLKSGLFLSTQENFTLIKESAVKDKTPLTVNTPGRGMPTITGSFPNIT